MPESARPLLVRKAAAALRDTELKERGAAWMDSYDILIEKIKNQPNREDFTKKLKDDCKPLGS